MNSVVEHLDNPVATLESIRNILSPGGVLFINVPSWLGKTLLEFLAFKLHLSPAEEMEDHRRYYSKRELWLELRAAGFTPSKIKIRRHKFLTNVYAIVEM
jgi:2-polyprenyl-3-methyl-5-hydroxy-6-metoxy-1,4-benzoquinol methylase